MSESELDYHFQTIGRILAFLINSGLKRVDLSSSDAMDIMTYRKGDEEEVLSTFADTLHWMNNEGLIHVGSIQEYERGYNFNGVQLSSRGLAIVKQKPSDPALGESIKDKVSEGSLSSEIYGKIGEFVGAALGGFTKAIGSG